MLFKLESGNLRSAVLEERSSICQPVFPPIPNICLPRLTDQSWRDSRLLHSDQQVPRYCQWFLWCKTGKCIEKLWIITFLTFQEGLFQPMGGPLSTPEGSDSSGFSEKAGSSEASCPDYCRERVHESGQPPPYSAKVCLAGYNDRNIREQSGKVFPSDVQIMAGKSGCVNPALTDCPYSTLQRWESFCFHTFLLNVWYEWSCWKYPISIFNKRCFFKSIIKSLISFSDFIYSILYSHLKILREVVDCCWSPCLFLVTTCKLIECQKI